MNRQSILCELQNIFRKVSEDESLILNENSVINGTVGEEVIGISSIDFVTAMVDIEDKYNIIIDFTVQINTVKDLIDAIILYKQMGENNDCSET